MVHLKLILDEEKLVSKYRKFANENMSKKVRALNIYTKTNKFGIKL